MATKRMNPDQLVIYGTAFGLLMIGLALLWAVGWRRQDVLSDWFPRSHWALDLALGGLLGGCYALLVWMLVHRFERLRHLEDIVLQSLDMEALRPIHAPIFGLIAGIPEEILFRGAMQPTFGWVITSLIFGALHGVTPLYFVYAWSAGALLGRLVIWQGNLWSAIAAHAVIDTIMFLLLIRDWRHRPGQNGA